MKENENRVVASMRVLLLVCVAAATLVGCGSVARRNASLSAVQIAVERLNGQTSQVEPLSPGQQLKIFEGDGVGINQSGYAKLDMSKCILDIYRDSALHVKGVPSESAPVCIVAFEHGTLLATVSVETIVDADWAVITALGTQFFVHRDLDRELVWLVVIQGTVMFEADGRQIKVGPGQQVWMTRGSAPALVGPATRAYVQDLFPRVEDLTTGILTDWQVLSDQHVAANVLTPSATPFLVVTRTPSPRVTSAPTAGPTNAQSARATITATSTRTATARPQPAATATATATPGPQLGPQNAAVYFETGNVWVTYRLANAVAELDGEDPAKVLRTIKGIDSPNGIVIWQAGGRAYVTNREKGTVTELDLKSGKVLQVLAVDAQGAPAATRPLPFGVAVDESTGDLYVANYGSSTLWYYNADARKGTNMKWPERPVHAAHTLAIESTWVLSSNGIVRAITRGDPGKMYEVPAGAFDLAIADDGLGGYATNPDTKRVITWGEGVKGDFTLKNAPYAISNMGGCIGVVVPAENTLYALDLGLTKVLRTYDLGKQGIDNGGQGIAANHRTDMVYVTNYAADSVTAIASPCQ